MCEIGYALGRNLFVHVARCEFVSLRKLLDSTLGWDAWLSQRLQGPYQEFESAWHGTRRFKRRPIPLWCSAEEGTKS